MLNVFAFRIATGLTIVFMSLNMVGCGSSEPPLKLIKVTGKVTLDDKPISGVVLMFNPLPKTLGRGGFAVSDDQGEFVVMHMSGKKGIEAGDYGMTFSKITQPDGSPIPKGKTPAGVKTVEQMPIVYTKFEPSRPVEKTSINADTTTVEFKLDSKKQSTGQPGMPR